MYDLIIIGGGPAGITAGIYAQRARLKVVLLEREILGGQIAKSDVIENYPGFPTISGRELMEKFEEHARGLDLDIKIEGVETVTTENGIHTVKTTEGEYQTKAVIVATGAKPRPLGVPGEAEFTGKGVSYCATCDGPFFRNRTIVVVGGGDTAVKEAVYLSKIATKVYLVHRRDQLRAEKILQEKAIKSDKIEILWSHVLQEITGEGGVDHAVVKNLKTEEVTTLDVHGAFIFVGINPTTDFVNVEKDDQRFIIATQKMETSVPGIFVAGDCRNTPLLQVSTAVGDGATSAFIAENYIEDLE